MKYIFIDTNQYRHIFSESEGFSDTVYNLLERLVNHNKIVLLLPQQTKDEITRNIARGWPEDEQKDCDDKIEKIRKSKSEVTEKYAEYPSHKKLLQELDKKIVFLEKKKLKIVKKFFGKSPNINRLNKLLKLGKLIQNTDDQISNARLRRDKGNPPKNNSCLGDQIIWEALLDFLSKDKIKRCFELLFVANDNNAWGKNGFDKYLFEEFGVKTKGTIRFCKALSDIEELTADEQSRLVVEEREQLTRNAIMRFVNSESYIDAGNNAQTLIEYKDMLTESDYKTIIEAAIQNHEIRQSFFTSIPLKALVDGENNYVTQELETLDLNTWQKFCEYYNCSLVRQVDQISTAGATLSGTEDVPF